MINRISGVLRGKEPAVCFIETGGIEWEIGISAVTYGSLPEVSEPCSLLTVLIHREDQMRIFGFSERTERELFLNLMKVSGIGAKQAVRILSRVRPDDLIAILSAGDAGALSTVPGVGIKTAQKIILTLKGKLELPATQMKEKGSDIVDALCDMGFDRKQASKAVQNLLDEHSASESGGGAPSEGEIFRRAIVILST